MRNIEPALGVEHPLADLRVLPAVATGALRAVGVEPRGTLAAALVHAATDVLLACTIAKALPVEANFSAAIQVLDTLAHGQPKEILLAQSKLLAHIAALPAEQASSETDAPSAAVTSQRIGTIAAMIDHQISILLEDEGQ